VDNFDGNLELKRLDLEWPSRLSRVVLTAATLRGASHTFFYENLVAASVECSSRIVEVARRNEISRAKNFFATFS